MFKNPPKQKPWFNNKIEARESPLHGLGVFALENIIKHECVERSPVLCFHKDSMYLLRKEMVKTYQRHVLQDYVFSWVEGNVAIALGYGSLYNHSNDESNITFRMRPDLPAIEFIAKRDIKEGEELLVHYRRGERDVDFDVSGGLI